MTIIVDLAVIDIEELDGSLDDLIDKLIAYRDIAEHRQLENVRTVTDYSDDDGWELFILGDEKE